MIKNVLNLWCYLYENPTLFLWIKESICKHICGSVWNKFWLACPQNAICGKGNANLQNYAMEFNAIQVQE